MDIVGTWVDAAVEKPEKDEQVLVYSEDYAGPVEMWKKRGICPIQMGRYIADLGEWRVAGSPNGWVVTHWARLIGPLIGPRENTVPVTNP